MTSFTHLFWPSSIFKALFFKTKLSITLSGFFTSSKIGLLSLCLIAVTACSSRKFICYLPQGDSK